MGELTDCNTIDVPRRSVPERFMARRPSPAGPGWDVLIKWTNLGHEHATWEGPRLLAHVLSSHTSPQDMIHAGSSNKLQPLHCRCTALRWCLLTHSHLVGPEMSAG